jgi:hypothetical protein
VQHHTDEFSREEEEPVEEENEAEKGQPRKSHRKRANKDIFDPSHVVSPRNQKNLDKEINVDVLKDAFSEYDESMNVDIPNIDTIKRIEAQIRDLVERIIPSRKQKQKGRYSKHDSARLAFCRGRALVDLYMGKLPSDEDLCALFLPGVDEKDEKGNRLLTKKDEEFMDSWCEKVKPDPRAIKPIDTDKQLLLTKMWCSSDNKMSICKRCVVFILLYFCSCCQFHHHGHLKY